MNKKSSVDCIICTYKDSDRLSLSLTSLSHQYQLRFNQILIIVDDGYSSIIEKKKLVKKIENHINKPKFKKIKKSIKIHYNKNNFGLGVSRNIGIKSSKSKYFTFLDCGDELTLNFLQSFQKYLKFNYDILHGRLLKYFVNQNNCNLQGPINSFNYSYKYFFDKIFMLALPNQATARLYRNVFIKKNKIYFLNRNVYHEDLAFTYKAVFFSKKQYFLENLFVYKWNFIPNSISSNFTNKHLLDFLFIIKDARKFFEKNKNINYRFFYINSRLYNFISGKISVTGNNLVSQFKKIIDHAMVQQVGRKLTIYDIHKSIRHRITKKIVDYYALARIKFFLSKTFSQKIKIIYRVLFRKNIVLTKPKMLQVIVNPKENKNITLLKKFKNKYKNKRCFIVGNGPSLNKTDLRKIKNEFTFGFNSIFLHKYFLPKFYIVEDKWVIKDNLNKIKKLKIKNKFIPAHYQDQFNHKDGCIHYPMDLSFYRNGKCRFTEDITKNLYSGQTVTYHAIQFAYYMGFNPIYLVGVDFNYIKPKTIIENGKTWHSTGDDPNHFNKNYFGAGKTFHDPQLDKVKKNYEFANQFLQNKNIKIYDATIDGKLDVFPKIKYQSLFKKK
jgi:hypothetical protein